MTTTTTTTSFAPFAWQDKRLLRRIREQCEDPSSALGVYVALTVIASDMEKEEFQTTHQWLASMSGFCERTVRSRLADLQRLGVISITTPTMRAPCTYRLLLFGNNDRTHGNSCRTFGNRTPLSITEIRRKERTEDRTQLPNEKPARPGSLPFKGALADIALSSGGCS